MRGGMQIALTLVATGPADVQAALRLVTPALGAAGVRVKEPRPLGPGAIDILLEGPDLVTVRSTLKPVLEDMAVDACVQHWEGRRKRLLVADMDSTIIGCECIDELADFAGVKAQVSEITERAMRGELDFEAALRERVGMLRGLPLEDLQRAYDERVRLNPGARCLVRTMSANGARCVLVSGGFTFFTSRVAAAAGFDDNQANRLGEADGRLSGEVGEPILGREAKLAALEAEAAALGVGLEACVALGDGANDLAMIERAGLGVAYRAKPVVAAQADAKLDHADLTGLLYFQGYRREEFVED